MKKKIIISILILLLTAFLLGKVIDSNKHKHFKVLNDMAEGQMFHQTLLLEDGRVLSVGNIIQVYDPKNDTWLKLDTSVKYSDYPGPELFILPNNKVLMLDTEGNQLFDPVTNQVTYLGKTLIDRKYTFTFPALLKDNLVYVLICKNRKGNDIIDEIDMYDVTKNKITRTIKLNTPVKPAPFLTLNDNQLLFLENGQDIKILDLNDFSVKNSGKLSSYKKYWKLLNLKNGTILVIGSKDYGGLNTIELFDYQKGKTLRILKSKNLIGSGINPILLKNGNILIIGMGKNHKKAFLYDLKNEKLISLGETHFKRYGSALTLLKDNSVLIIGGLYFQGETQMGLKKVELYVPENE